MSSNIDRYRPAREAYPPPSSLPPKPPTSLVERPSKSPSRRRDNVPPAVPTPPSLSSRTSPPRPHSRRSAESPAHSSSPRHQKPRRDQWLFTREEVLSTPSIIGGMSVAEERLRRAKGINFIKQAGVLLTLPATTVWVACVFFHRFYMRHSMEPEKGGIHHYNIAATSLFLANKTEEICRKTKDVIIAVGKVAQKDSKLELDEQSKEYWRWRDSILAFEEVMLESLTFDLSVDNPLSELRKQFKQLNLPSECALKESTWAFCNDACLTVLPLLLSAKDVACGALFFALTVSKTQLEDIDGRPWWEVINGTEENIALAVNTLSDFYRDNPIRKKDPNIPASPLFDLGGTRRLAGTPTPTSPRPKVNGKSEGSSNHYQSQQHEINTNGNNNAVGAKEASVPPAVKQEDEGEQRDRVASEAAPPRPSIEVSTSEQQRGDSDAALKAAANDLSIHDRPYRPKAEDDGGGLVSPQKFSKRKSAELEEGEEREERETKKQRLEGDVKQERIEDEDEGEIKGS